jgi:hypothetical protein
MPATEVQLIERLETERRTRIAIVTTLHSAAANPACITVRRMKALHPTAEITSDKLASVHPIHRLERGKGRASQGRNNIEQLDGTVCETDELRNRGSPCYSMFISELRPPT